METKIKTATVKVLSEQLGKVPPQAVEIEEVVLGAMMLERESVYECIHILNPSDFYKEAHALVFEAITNLFSHSDPIDIKTVTHELRKMGKLEDAGGVYYISQLTSKINSAANIEAHSRIIKEMAMKRELIRISNEIQQDAYEDTMDVFKLMDRTYQNLEDVSSGTGLITVESMAQLMPSVIEYASSAKAARQNNEFIGVPSGILALDRVTGGFKNSDLIIIAARPSMGKTALVTTVLMNCGINLDIPVGLLSLEMSSLQITQRIASSWLQIPLDAFTHGKYQDYEFEQIVHKGGKIEKGKIYIDDQPALSPFEIRTKARMMQRKYGIRMLILDYIQLCQVPGSKSRENEVGMISRSLKAVAKDLDIPIIALSQLSRDVEKRGGEKKPMLSDLRDSGSIEQDADMIIFPYRPEYYGVTEIEFDGMGNTSAKGMGELIIAKNRNGATDSVWANFVGKYTLWKDIEKEPTHNWSQLPKENDKDGMPF